LTPRSSAIPLKPNLDYPIPITETVQFRVGADFFNIANSKRITRVREFEDLTFGVPDIDFRTPRAFQRPFSARVGLRLEF